jgi:hypothetical protein
MDVAENPDTAAKVKPFIPQMVGPIVQCINNPGEKALTQQTAM